MSGRSPPTPPVVFAAGFKKWPFFWPFLTPRIPGVSPGARAGGRPVRNMALIADPGFRVERAARGPRRAPARPGARPGPRARLDTDPARTPKSGVFPTPPRTPKIGGFPDPRNRGDPGLGMAVTDITGTG